MASLGESCDQMGSTDQHASADVNVMDHVNLTNSEGSDFPSSERAASVYDMSKGVNPNPLPSNISENAALAEQADNPQTMTVPQPNSSTDIMAASGEISAAAAPMQPEAATTPSYGHLESDKSSIQEFTESDKKTVSFQGYTAIDDVVQYSGNQDSNAIDQSAQQIIEDLNAKRKQDTQVLENFRKAVNEQVDLDMDELHQGVFQMYEHQQAQMNERVQEVFATLERIRVLEAELVQFKQGLGVFYQDMGPDAGQPAV